MKLLRRGRPEIEDDIVPLIVKIFEKMDTPLTPSHVRMLIEEEFQKGVSHNTIKKYIEKLFKIGRLKVAMENTFQRGGKPLKIIYYELAL